MPSIALSPLRADEYVAESVAVGISSACDGAAELLVVRSAWTQERDRWRGRRAGSASEKELRASG
jgi:hypothetical protein